MASSIDLTIKIKKVTNELFSANNFRCFKLYYGKNVYYYFVDVLLCLNHDEKKTKMLKTLKEVNDCDKFYIKDLEEIYKNLLKDSLISNINKEVIDVLKNEKDCIFVNNKALYFLINNAIKEKSKPFQDFIYYTLLPALDNVFEEYINQSSNSGKQRTAKNSNKQLQKYEKTDNDELLESVKTLKEDMESMKNIKEDLKILKKDMKILKDEIEILKDEMENVRDEMDDDIISLNNNNLKNINNLLDECYYILIHRLQGELKKLYIVTGLGKNISKKIKNVKNTDILLCIKNDDIEYVKALRDVSYNIDFDLKEEIDETVSKNHNKSSMNYKKEFNNIYNKKKQFQLRGNNYIDLYNTTEYELCKHIRDIKRNYTY